jgi:diadenosine tetraphosphate (Ap4A) HIT family hydrolase
MTNSCPFCTINPAVEIVAETPTALAILDSFPVNPGHTLIIPRRHVASYFELSTDEQNALWQLVNTTKTLLENRYRPDGFNIGINIGETAGQSVMHVHIHLIPRYKGDVEQPRGGVRGVIPGKQSY